MAKFRRKQKFIEAEQWNGSDKSAKRIGLRILWGSDEWCVPGTGTRNYKIAHWGDWIVKSEFGVHLFTEQEFEELFEPLSKPKCELTSRKLDL